jgi:hypothetical protein
MVRGWRWYFRWNLRPTSWRDDGPTNNYTKTVARRMLLYPVRSPTRHTHTRIVTRVPFSQVVYTALILPIAAIRFHNWSGHIIPFEATIFSAVVYLLSGEPSYSTKIGSD